MSAQRPTIILPGRDDAEIQRTTGVHAGRLQVVREAIQAVQTAVNPPAKKEPDANSNQQ